MSRPSGIECPVNGSFMCSATALALDNPLPVDPDEEDLVLFLGFDANGVPLEVMGIELDDGSLMVIHALRLRRKYERRLRELYR